MEYSKTKEEIKKTLLLGEFEKAKNLIAAYEVSMPHDLESYSLKANYCFLIGKYEEAEQMLKEAMSKRPLNFDLHYNLAMVYQAQQKKELAWKYFNVANTLTESESQRNAVQEALDAMIQQTKEDCVEIEELKRQLEAYKEISKAIEQEAINSYTSFPAQGENLLIGEELEGYYIGLYDGMKIERDGIDCVPLRSFNKVEMFKSGFEQKQSSEEYILPVATKRINGEFHVKHRDSKHVFDLKFPNRWYYFRLNPSSEIVKDENLILGEPISLAKDNSKEDLVLTVFVDGLSQTVLEKYGLERLMPNTHRFFKDGMWCKNVYVSGEWTYVNMASFYSGKYTASHNMFHPNKNATLPKESKILSEQFKGAGYMTAKIDGDWRSTPMYGYYRGFDRIVYQPSLRGMDAPDAIYEVIEHLEAFKGTNQFVWTCLPDLHDVADGFQGSISMQVSETMEEKPHNQQHLQGKTSVRQDFSMVKTTRYTKQIQRIDRYLGMLYTYLEQNFDMDRVTVALISDHGQGYLVPNGDHMLCEERVKVPFMFRGRNVKAGETDELIQGLDLMSILCKLANIEIDSGDTAMNLPKCFGGQQEREFTYSESIFPGDSYKASIHTKKLAFYYETDEKVLQDGSVNMEKYTVKLVDKHTRQLVTDNALEEKFIEIIHKHMKNRRIYV
ncbi:sulfatase-like hydrolase/transferase [Paenibacillus thiaminolyticus]|uniref:sulfatase-like hydrolase/transferase n=1 Tax=Paenibacillus thiaminolyticus TaxID=49283 RepID=UPI002543660D|nr:sulfatase-like hydrolase/transferase [Paenibacillus thiaminolyticus]WII37222.1 sulfatase-like hydrolase/transferase [Paenibacillus thiaminolyticus]